MIAHRGAWMSFSRHAGKSSAERSPTLCAGDVSHRLRTVNTARRRVLLVDLNNFSTFPTYAVGILVAGLRQAGHDVEVLCPLAYDVPAAEREWRETLRDHWARRIHLSTWGPFRFARDAARDLRLWWMNRPHPNVLRETKRALENRPDIILLSAYLQHYPTVVEIGRLAVAANVPLLLGGPMFNVQGVADAWRDVPGARAIFGGEADLIVADLVNCVCESGDLLQFDGVLLPTGQRSQPARPLRDLDRVPIPDFSDFPWDRYRFRIIPLVTGRGCQWNRCTFCSDIVSASMRTFRTRSTESVLGEMREQFQRHQTTNFLFLDLKLNSNPALLRGIVENVQAYVPGAQWIGSVHVDLRRDNGLSRRELQAAVSAGMRRVSFGLETGSQRLLEAMDKGSSVAANSEFIRNAHEAGLSIRCTMFKGFPGETAEDLEQTSQFLEAHTDYIDRVRMNEFSVREDTPIFNALLRRSPAYPQLQVTRVDHRNARAHYRHPESGDRAYRRAKARVLRAVYHINRKEIRCEAKSFDGLM